MGKDVSFLFMSKVNMGTLPSTQNTFSVLLDSVFAVTALITNCDKSQIVTVVSQFVTVAICDGSKHNFSDRFHSNRGYTPKCRKHVHIKIGPFQEGFLGTSIMGFITDIHTHKQIYQWNKTKMGKNATFHIHVKSEPGYSPKYPEHVFSVIRLSLCRHGFDHKLRQITNCHGSVAICDCRNLWRFKTQLFRLMSIVLEGVLCYIVFLPILVLFHWFIFLCVCIAVIKLIIVVPGKPSWKGPILMWICFLNLGIYPRLLLISIWEVVFWTITNYDSHNLRQIRFPCRRNLWFVAIWDQERAVANSVQ